MPRYRRRKERHWSDAAPLEVLAGLLALAWAFLPGFRALVLWILILAIVIGAIVLVFFVLQKMKYFQGGYQSNTSTPFSRPPIKPAAARTAAPESDPLDDTRYQPRIIISNPTTSAKPESSRIFTPELLSALEWRSFEKLVALFFQKTGYDARRSRVGADGGVDIIIRHPGEFQPSGYVQCKALNSAVGVKLMREFFGVMVSDKIPHGFFVTTSDFTFDAIEFARGKSLVLVNGADLLKDLNGLPEPTRCAIITEITSEDYTTPTCPSCDVKMTQRQGPTGTFWGCINYPRCNRTLSIRGE
jgi:restriction system protein